MPNNNLFAPNPTGTVGITTSAASQRVALQKGQAQQVRIKNIDATNMVYVEFGDASVVAVIPNGSTKGSLPIGPGETVGITIGVNVTHAAAIAGGGTPIVYFSPGYGN